MSVTASGTYPSRRNQRAGWVPLVLLVTIALGAAPLHGVDRTFGFSGTVSSSGLSAIAPGTAFSGSYTVDDAAVDADASADLGSYPTGEFTLDIDGVGTVSMDQAGFTTVLNDQPVVLTFQRDALVIFADEGARTLSFTNEVQQGTMSLQTTVDGSPTTLTGDSLTAAIAVQFMDWNQGAMTLTFSAAGDASCPPLSTNCPVVFAIDALAEVFTLDVTKDGVGTGVVTSLPAGIDCGATCSGSFSGMVTLTATPDGGSAFVGWIGCDSVVGDECTVDVSSDRAVNATFEVATYLLTVTKAGTGTGTVTSTPAGIDCGATCSASFAGMAILSPTADAGSTFVGWVGCDSVAGDVCELFLDEGDETVEATFELEAVEEETPIPTLSEWGLILLTTMLAALGALYLSRRGL